jgi:hypothetical protein
MYTSEWYRRVCAEYSEASREAKVKTEGKGDEVALPLV